MMKPVIVILSCFLVGRLLCRIKKVISTMTACYRLYTAVLTLCRRA